MKTARDYANELFFLLERVDGSSNDHVVTIEGVISTVIADTRREAIEEVEKIRRGANVIPRYLVINRIRRLFETCPDPVPYSEGDACGLPMPCATHCTYPEHVPLVEAPLSGSWIWKCPACGHMTTNAEYGKVDDD